MEYGTIFSLGLYFLLMLGIGFYYFKNTENNVGGYMLGGRTLSPAVTALSAGASDMSGWMLMGLPGAMYISGLSGAWVAVGLVIGAYANYVFVAPRLRVFTEAVGNANTIPEYFENRFEDKTKLLRAVASIVIIIFFAVYTTSGVVAGGKLFESSFGLSYQTGLMITAFVVVAYTAFGGFMAVSTTDFVQGCIMFIALILVPVVVLSDVGGITAAANQLNQINPVLLNVTSGITVLGAVSTMAWGLGYFGQPHIIVRFMAIRSVREIKTARRIGMSWMIVTLVGALAVGLLGLVYATKVGADIKDPETIFIFLSTTLFHPIISGFLLAAILAAIMSTISSQLLVTSSSLSSDFYHSFIRRNASQSELVFVGRICVVLVAVLAIILAQDRNATILSLVSHAWAGFGAAFGPLVILSLHWQRMTRQGALAGMLVGASTVLVWVYAPITVNGQSLSSLLYEMVPGFIFAWIAIVIVSLMTKPPSESMLNSFKKMKKDISFE